VTWKSTSSNGLGYFDCVTGLGFESYVCHTKANPILFLKPILKAPIKAKIEVKGRVFGHCGGLL